MKVRLPSFAYSENLKVHEDKPELVELAPDETSLHFLQKVYRSTKQPMSLRMRAATEALPHEHPRLGAVAIGYLQGNDFASRLDRAVEASNRAKFIEGRLLEGPSSAGDRSDGE